MASQHVDLLEPVDLFDRVKELKLSFGQVCALAGITKTQLDYWTSRAGLSTSGRKQRSYGVAEAELVMLIKQGRDKGLSLPTAIDAARVFVERRTNGSAVA